MPEYFSSIYRLLEPRIIVFVLIYNLFKPNDSCVRAPSCNTQCNSYWIEKYDWHYLTSNISGDRLRLTRVV